MSTQTGLRIGAQYIAKWARLIITYLFLSSISRTLIYRLRRGHWHYEPLVLQEVGLVRVVADQILQGVELATPDVEVAAYRRDPEIKTQNSNLCNSKART